ncbi:MAG: hypothetical protein PG981_000557 [Wolbachia endosymbiont of Ctenocephalides orientis wCori]|nr:MAG: hypothetical protein PG981_000557 [Wolbachia endosymbiont of Ctenocephalides orientis wCori]
MIILLQKAFSAHSKESYLLILHNILLNKLELPYLSTLKFFIINNDIILLLTIAFLNFLIHHFHDKNVLTTCLLFLGKVILAFGLSTGKGWEMCEGVVSSKINKPNTKQPAQTAEATIPTTTF